MTFSIAARSADGRQHGVAVASKFLAVGSAVPAAEAGVGALATQSYANLAYRIQGLTLLRTGVDPEGVVAGLTAADPERAQRQLGVVGVTGGGASFTGEECHGWAGGTTGDGYAIQGNILTGPHVVQAMERAWLDADPGSDFAERLTAVLVAGDAAGGDRRGRQSAALHIVEPGGGYGGLSDVSVDLRVDDHPDPVGELRRLLRIHRRYFTPPDPDAALPLASDVAVEVRKRLDQLGWSADDTAAGLDSALAGWAGVENYEERLLPGKIDPDVLEALREATQG
ncbi:MAG: DUF1028 domain-containing protein [Micromonosporaceae bacterium]|nr:DUF1028 domain-containing protein [Micromonosporaceae bacterium]